MFVIRTETWPKKLNQDEMQTVCVLCNSLHMSYEKVIELENFMTRYILIFQHYSNDEQRYGLFL